MSSGSEGGMIITNNEDLAIKLEIAGNNTKIWASQAEHQLL